VSLLARISRWPGSLAGYVCRLPQSIILRTKLRQRQVALEVLEAERLDRIRNPHKYHCR